MNAETAHPGRARPGLIEASPRWPGRRHDGIRGARAPASLKRKDRNGPFSSTRCIRGARAPASLKRPALRMTVIASFLGGGSVDNLEQLRERCFVDACPAHELLKLVHPFGIRKILDRDVLVDNGVMGIT